jgi:hypothetical protein
MLQKAEIFHFKTNTEIVCESVFATTDEYNYLHPFNDENSYPK